MFYYYNLGVFDQIYEKIKIYPNHRKTSNYFYRVDHYALSIKILPVNDNIVMLKHPHYLPYFAACDFYLSPTVIYALN